MQASLQGAGAAEGQESVTRVPTSVSCHSLPSPPALQGPQHLPPKVPATPRIDDRVKQGVKGGKGKKIMGFVEDRAGPDGTGEV